MENEVEMYSQMTLDQWLSMKERLQKEIMGVKTGFVRIGFLLRKMEEGRGYELEGYKSLADYAKQELGLEATAVSRFKKINEQFSVDGYSEMIDPKYADYKQSSLSEMLTLSIEDRQMVTPETPRADIRELKAHEKEMKKAVKKKTSVKPGKKPEPQVTEEKEEIAPAQFPLQNKERPTKKIESEAELIEEFYCQNPDIVKELYERWLSESSGRDIEKAKEIVNPSGNRTFKYGIWIMMMNERYVSVKKLINNPVTIMWEKFFTCTEEIFGKSQEIREMLGTAQIVSESVPEGGEATQTETVSTQIVSGTAQEVPEEAQEEIEHVEAEVIENPELFDTPKGSHNELVRKRVEDRMTEFKVQSRAQLHQLNQFVTANAWKEAVREIRLLLSSAEVVLECERKLEEMQ